MASNWDDRNDWKAGLDYARTLDVSYYEKLKNIALKEGYKSVRDYLTRTSFGNKNFIDGFLQRWSLNVKKDEAGVIA